jgi:D-alanyl-D-alanine carboxypeptidase
MSPETAETPDVTSVAALFERAFQDWMASHGLSRGSLAIMRDNRLVFRSGYGGRGPDDRVPIWSLSKAITAACIASLIKDGRLELVQTVGQLLSPVYARFGEPVDKRLSRVTVDQLLSHRSGIPRAFDGNAFAPGLVELLRHYPPRRATIEMLMPLIMTVSLIREPGVAFEYANVGYILLGQIIEALTGQDYAVACAERVLAKAGIAKRPSLDPDWGGIMSAASGWALSGPEYLAFSRLLYMRDPDLFTPSVVAFLQSPEGRWSNADRTVAYTLGVLVHPQVDAAPSLSHSGGHNWNQADAAGGPIDEVRGTSFFLGGDSVGWFASYDGLSAGTDPQAVNALHRAFLRARDRVTAWPQHDDFPALGLD